MNNSNVWDHLDFFLWVKICQRNLHQAPQVKVLVSLLFLTHAPLDIYFDPVSPCHWFPSVLFWCDLSFYLYPGWLSGSWSSQSACHGLKSRASDCACFSLCIASPRCLLISIFIFSDVASPKCLLIWIYNFRTNPERSRKLWVIDLWNLCHIWLRGRTLWGQMTLQ